MLMMQVAAAVLSYGAQILLARWMGVFEFGLYAVAWSLVPPAAAVAAIGLPSASIRFVPQYLTRKDSGQLHGLIRRSVLIVLAVGLISVGAGWLILAAIDPWLADYYIGPIKVALFCVPFLTVIILVSDMSRGFGWAGLAFAPQWLLMPGLMIAGVFVYTVTAGRPTAGWVLAIAAGASAVTAVVHLGVFRFGVAATIRGAAPRYDTRSWLRVAIPLLLSDGVFLLLWSCDEVMLGAMTEPEEVAVFHASVKTAGLTLLIFNAVAAFAGPRFSALWIEQDTPKLRQFTASIARWMFFPSLVLTAGLILLGPFLLSVFGEAFVEGHTILVVLTLGYLFKAATGPVGAYLAVSDNHDTIVVVTAVSAVSNIVLNFLLIPHYGAMGAAVASVIAVVMCQGWQYVLVRRRLGINSLFLAWR